MLPTRCVVTQTRSSDENWNGDCDYCVADFDLTFVELLLKRMATLKEMREKDWETYEVSYWCSLPHYFTDSERVEEHLSFKEDEVVVHPRGEELRWLRQEDYKRTECDRVIVQPNFAYFESYVRHTSVVITSAHFTKYMLIELRDLLLQEKEEWSDGTIQRNT